MLKAFAIFRAVNRIRTRADDGHTGRCQCFDQLQRRLATKLHNHALRLFDVDNTQHVFKGDRLEIQTIRGVVVGGNCFRIAVDHDGFVTILAHRKRGMHTAIIEFDALTDAIRAAAQHHDLVVCGGIRLALQLVGGIHVCGRRGKLRRAGIDALERRFHTKFEPISAHVAFLGMKQRA